MAIVAREPVTAKFISANCNFLPCSSNPPNIIPANISSYTVSTLMCMQCIVKIHCPLCISLPAPSAAPTSVRTSSNSSSSITVQWGAVDCIHHNGDITGYSVQYWVVGSGSTQTMSVSGGSATEATISSLMSSTTYSIQVAAVNSAGIGLYSAPINQLTLG